jgi:uncharacterized protein with ATP-grasp and redox domains
VKSFSGKGKVMAVVKGTPVLSDANIDDACRTRLTELREVVDNGPVEIGTTL